MEKNLPKAGFKQGMVLVLVNLLPMMGVVALMPVVPALLDHFKEVPNIKTLAPLVLSAPGLCIAILSPFAGYFIDKIGRRKLLIYLMVLYGIGGVLPFFIDNFWALMGGRFLLGIGEAFIMTIVNVLMGDYFEGKQRSSWLMWQGIIGTACGTLLLMLSGKLATFGWQFPFLVYASAFVFSFIAWLYIYETKSIVQSSQLKPSWNLIPKKLIGQLYLLTLSTSIIYFVYTLHFSMALSEIGIHDNVELGNLSAIASLAVPIGALLFKLMSKRTIQFQLFFISLLLGIGMYGIGISKSSNEVVVYAFLQQLACGMTIPVLVAWGLNIIPIEFRGTGMGFWSSGFFLGMFICPIVVSFISNQMGGIVAAFKFFGLLCLILTLTNLIIYFINKPKKQLA